MTTIRSDGQVSDGFGKHQDHPFSYLDFERVEAACETLRRFNAFYGFYEQQQDGRETFNLGANPNALSPARQAEAPPSGVALPFTLAQGETPVRSPARGESTTLRPKIRLTSETGATLAATSSKQELLRSTNGAYATLNALARALAAGLTDAEGHDAPQLTAGWLPEAFANYWAIQGAPEDDEEWGQGAARALTEFNLGAQVNPLKLIRGDVVQMGASPQDPLLGQPSFVYAARRVREGEVRFVYLSSQTDTFGVGVPINDLARRALCEREMGLVFRASLADEDGTILSEARYEVEVNGEVFSGQTDEKGRVEIALPTGSTKGQLRFWLDEGTEDEEEIEWPLRFKKQAPKPDDEDDGDDEGELAADEDAFEGGHDPAETHDAKSVPPGDPIPGTSRKEWVVSRGGAPEERYVYHPDSLGTPTFVTHALRYGKWQICLPGEEKGYGLYHPWHGQTFVARPYMEFPRYPIALGGTADLDYTIQTEDEGAVTVPLEETLTRYYRNTERLDGGYYPFGRSRTWHSGVHFEPEEEALTVFAPFDGRIVAARIGEYEEQVEGTEPRYPYGSPNFVLLKHGVEIGGTQHEFFTLYMHLDAIPLALQGDQRTLTLEASRTPWIRELALAPDRDAEKEKVADLDWTKLYLEVTHLPEAGARFGDPETGTELQIGDFLEVAGAEVNELQWQAYNGNKAAEMTLVRDGSKAEFDPQDFLGSGGGLMPVDAHPLRYTELKEKLMRGEVVDLWDETLIVRCGEPIGTSGTWHASRRLHMEVFSADLIPVKIAGAIDASTGEPSMTAKEAVDVDTAGDTKVFYDRLEFLKTFLDEVEAKGNEADGLDGEDLGLRLRERMLRDVVSKEDVDVIRESEVQAFFNDANNSLLPLLRSLTVRHLSEWGDKVTWENLKQAKDSLGDPLEEHLEAIGKIGARYAWWKGELGKEAGLPTDQIAHFYHPVTFLRWLEHERREELAAGQADALHKSVFDLNHDWWEDGGEALDSGTQNLKVSLADEDGDPLEGCKYELHVAGEVFEGTSGEGGKIEHDVPAEAIEAELTFWLDDDESYTWPLKIR